MLIQYCVRHRFLLRDAMHKRGLRHRAVAAWLADWRLCYLSTHTQFVYVSKVETSKRFLKLFHFLVAV